MDPSLIYAMTSAGPITLRNLKFGRNDGLDFGNLMYEQSSMIFYSPRAKANQHSRNAKEARERRHAEKISPATNAASQIAPDNTKSGAADSSNALDFSSSLARPFTPLEKME